MENMEKYLTQGDKQSKLTTRSEFLNNAIHKWSYFEIEYINAGLKTTSDCLRAKWTLTYAELPKVSEEILGLAYFQWRSQKQKLKKMLNDLLEIITVAVWVNDEGIETKKYMKIMARRKKKQKKRLLVDAIKNSDFMRLFRQQPHYMSH